jgi:hypothetical protein
LIWNFLYSFWIKVSYKSSSISTNQAAVKK